MRLLCKVSLAATLFAATNSANAQHSLKKLWATDSVLAIPESVLPAKDVLYASLINGEPWGKDGKGGVAKLSVAGKILSPNWITGLNAPKGMAISGDFLYVADVDDVVVISISKGKIDHKIKLIDATGLNDITIDSKGVIYVTDSNKGWVYKIDNEVQSIYFTDLKWVNGIKAVADKLYILTGDGVYIADAAKKLNKLCELEHGGDGIEPVGNGDFLVTAWEGYLYYVHADGRKEVLLDTHNSNNKTADIGYDAKTKTVYIPTFLGKSVVAYQLN